MEFDKIDLGSGSSPYQDYVGVDSFFASDRVVKSDVLSFLRKLPDGSVKKIYSRHFIEHLSVDDFFILLDEVDRVLVEGGEAMLIAPHFSNPYYYSDPTHRSFYGLYTFSYICRESCLKRSIPLYARYKNFVLRSVKLNFISMKPRRFVPSLSRILNKLVNSKRTILEFYERYFVWLYSPYEIEYKIEKISQ